MGWYDAIKDGISLAQKADNLPLVQSLIEAQKQIMDLLQENNQLKEEIKKLKVVEDLSQRIERHEDAYITLKDDEENIIYCSCCWDTKRVLVQGNLVNTGKYRCPACGNDSYFNREAFHKGQADAFSQMIKGAKY